MVEYVATCETCCDTCSYLSFGLLQSGRTVGGAKFRQYIVIESGRCTVGGVKFHAKAFGLLAPKLLTKEVRLDNAETFGTFPRPARLSFRWCDLFTGTNREEYTIHKGRVSPSRKSVCLCVWIQKLCTILRISIQTFNKFVKCLVLKNEII